MYILRSQHRKASSCLGIGLLELVISIAVLALVVGPVVRSSLTSQRLNVQSGETQRAVQILNNARLQIQEASQADLVDASGTLAPATPMVVPSNLENQAVTYTLPNWVAGGPVPDLLEVRLQITWTGARGENRSLALVDAFQ